MCRCRWNRADWLRSLSQTVPWLRSVTKLPIVIKGGWHHAPDSWCACVLIVAWAGVQCVAVSDPGVLERHHFLLPRLMIGGSVVGCRARCGGGR